jgi:hypothetical protein
LGTAEGQIAPGSEQDEEKHRQADVQRQPFPDERRQQEMVDQDKDQEGQEVFHLVAFVQSYALFSILRTDSLKK